MARQIKEIKMGGNKIKKTSKSSGRPNKLSYTQQLVFALALFTISVALSRGADMQQWEISVFEFVYGLPTFLHTPLFIITQVGSVYFFALLLLIFAYKKRFAAVTKLLLGGLLAYLASGFAKDMWGRARPHEFLENVANLDYVVRGPGFPSGHTALATVVLLTLGHYIPKKYRWTVPVLIILVGLSRVYLGIHAPLDILGGMALGWASYALVGHVRIYNSLSSIGKSLKK